MSHSNALFKKDFAFRDGWGITGEIHKNELGLSQTLTGGRDVRSQSGGTAT